MKFQKLVTSSMTHIQVKFSADQIQYYNLIVPTLSPISKPSIMVKNQTCKLSIHIFVYH